MSEMMQQQMKQILENMAIYDYKVIRFFENRDELQKAIDTFYNNGFKNINSRTLTDNYIEELYEIYIFIPGEGRRALLAAVFGALIGGILGWWQGSTMLSIPLLNPVSAGGLFASTILCAGTGAVLLSAFTAILI